MKPLSKAIQPSVPLRKFPTRQYLVYAFMQALTGLVIFFIPFGEYPRVREFFVPIDRYLPTFRTLFENAPDPTAGKVMLLLWWVVFIPWGLWWAGRWTHGFKPVIALRRVGIFKAMGWFFLGLVVTGVMTHIFSFMVHDNAAPAVVRLRRDILPYLMERGAFATALFLAVYSMVLICAIGATVVFFRLLVSPDPALPTKGKS